SESNGDHAKKNAFSYARVGACSVIEEMNMTGNILFSEVERILSDKAIRERMSHSAKAFYKPGSAEKIAREIFNIAISHEE
ncbi:MAG: hypothetical protein KBB16_01495, partial [Candidatus Pacebacteria bacterium]|nr:hypothetical protein [Candidatus Paceibacterota bacterium]